MAIYLYFDISYSIVRGLQNKSISRKRWPSYISLPKYASGRYALFRENSPGTNGLKVEANLTQILNFKANFHTEFEPFFKKKIYANNDGHFKIVSIKIKN